MAYSGFHSSLKKYVFSHRGDMAYPGVRNLHQIRIQENIYIQCVLGDGRGVPRVPKSALGPLSDPNLGLTPIELS